MSIEPSLLGAGHVHELANLPPTLHAEFITTSRLPSRDPQTLFEIEDDLNLPFAHGVLGHLQYLHISYPFSEW